eukprot:gene7382-11704_t
MSIIDEDEIFFKTALPFKEILTKPTLTKYFYEFSKKERNVEALDFYLQVLRYKNLKTKEERSEEEKIIYDKYLDVNSKYAINISVENILSVKQRSEEAPIDLYDTLQKEMEVLMMDSYRRFFKTPAYEEMLTNHQIDKKIKIFDEEAEDDNHTYQLTSPGIALRAVGKKNDFGMQSFRSLKEIEKTSASNINERMQKSKSVSSRALKISQNPSSQSERTLEEKKKSRRSEQQVKTKRKSRGIMGLFFPKSEAE